MDVTECTLGRDAVDRDWFAIPSANRPRSKIFYSRFYSHEYDQTAEMVSFLRDFVRICRRVNGFYKSDDPRHVQTLETIAAMAKYLIDLPGFVEYVADTCISEVTGPMSAKLRDEVIRLLHDPHLWVLRDAIRYSNDGVKTGSSYVHVDSDPDQSYPGHLRLGSSRHKSTVGYEGLVRESDRFHHFGIVNPMSNELMMKTRTFSPRSIFAWSRNRGLHERPTVSQSELNAFGGTRVLQSSTFDLSGIGRMAMRNLEIEPAFSANTQSALVI